MGNIPYYAANYEPYGFPWYVPTPDGGWEPGFEWRAFDTADDRDRFLAENPGWEAADISLIIIR